MTAELVGSKELANLFRMVADEVTGKQMENGLMKPARRLRNAIKDAAPEGPTGNLKDAVEAKRYRKLNRVLQSPAVYVRVNEKKAPHAHLVERGTKGNRYPGLHSKHPNGWLAYFNGEVHWITHTGQMPANPFFQRTVDHMSDGVIMSIESEVTKLIKKVWK